MIEISLNNDCITLAPATVLQQALEQWGYEQKKCAVAINGEFVPRSEYANVTLQHQDEVDIVAAVGGG
ncbi:hypothetical protein NBRC116494_27870 [Aurantivibrio plasticivorans]